MSQLGALAAQHIIWPTHARIAFSEYAEHPKSVDRPVGDVIGHWLQGLTVWDGIDGTPRLWMGYGGIGTNISPTWVVPLNLTTGDWDLDLGFAANCFAISRFYVYDDSIWAPGMDGQSDYIVGVPDGVGGIDWFDKIAITAQAWSGTAGFDHPLSMAFNGSEMYVAGQDFSDGVIWEGALYDAQPAGSIVRHFDADGAAGRISTMFWLDGVLYYQSQQSSDLYAWDGASTWTDTGLNLAGGQAGFHRLWHGEIWYDETDDGVSKFDGTEVTSQGLAGLSIQHINVGDDDALYALENNGDVWRLSEPGSTWRNIGNCPDGVSVAVHNGYVFVGDEHDAVWRAELGAWGL